MFREGLLLVISGPSGTGKGTLLNLIRQRNDNIRFSVSATTRKPRAGEVDGTNYFFKAEEEFKCMISNDELVEWVEYCGNYYGTPRKCIHDYMKQGLDVILEIEVEGAVNIKKQYPDSVLIFILPPAFDELKKRIEGRGTEKLDVIKKRLDKARTEMTFVDKYDYVIVNDTLEKALEEVTHILAAEKLKSNRNKNILKHIGME